VGDLGARAVTDELAIHEPQRPGAHLLDDLCGMVDDEHRPGGAPQLGHLDLAALLERGVTGGQGLVDQEDVRVRRGGDREPQA